MKYYILLALAVSCACASLFAQPTQATTGLQLTPLEYRTKLSQGEKKKGYVDVSNPSFERLIVTTSVQAFEQTNSKGALKFFDDEQIQTGVLLDLSEFELGPREAVRMYFQIDGSKLPSGDVYAALFMTGRSAREQVGVIPSVRVGTLLSIINGTPGERKAEITNVSANFLQVGNVSARYTIRNTGNAKRASGFYPEVNARLALFGSDETRIGSLVFAGNERENTIRLNGGIGGLYQLRVSYEGSYKDTYVFVLTPFSGLIVALLVMTALSILLYTRHRKRYAYRSRIAHKR